MCVYAHVHMPEGGCMHVVLIWFLLLCKDHDQKQLGVRKSLSGVYFCHGPSSREVRKDVQGRSLEAGTEAETAEEGGSPACSPQFAQLAF